MVDNFVAVYPIWDIDKLKYLLLLCIGLKFLIKKEMQKIYKLTSGSSLLLFILIFLISSFKANCADLAITFNISKYQNGNNISCNGAADGMIEAVIVGGASPYIYSWNTGSFNRILTGLSSGSYTFTVTDANSQTATSTVELIEPKVLELKLIPVIYGGYNISEQGGSDGKINTETKGGSQPYNYAWSNSSTEVNLGDLNAGTYSLTVTDVNGCTISASKTLTEPTPLHILSITSPQHHGFNISCKEGHDGQINLSVAGGVPPYKYDWSTGSFEENISDLAAGSYSVRITDDNDVEIITSIILTEPSGNVMVKFTPQVYGNGFNLSCHDCANGSLTAIGNSGVSPYTFIWSTTQTTSTISGLQAIDYNCTITDANGCSETQAYTLRAPDRDDWSMNGNANIDPTTQFMGTTDNKDFVVKTNNVERMRIGSQGNVGILNSLSAPRMVLNDELSFKGIHSISYQPATSSSRPRMSFGQPSTTSITSCVSPSLSQNPNYQFNGAIQVWENSASGGNLNILELGHDGANAIIDATGTSSDPLYNRLLINYYCGKDVIIGNVTSGDLTANHNFHVLGDINGSTLAGSGFNLLQSDGTGKIMKVSSSSDPNNEILYGNGSWNRLPSGSNVWSLLNGLISNNPVSTFVGIGTASPDKLLTVNGDVKFLGSGPNNDNEFEILSNNKMPYRRGISIDDNLGNFNFYIHDYLANSAFNFIQIQEDISYARTPINLLTIQKNGNVGIGIDDISKLANLDFKLSVNGGIRANMIKVYQYPWPDFVFSNGYRLMPLEEVEKFIKSNNQLPEMVSAKEVEANGLNIGETEAKLMQKVEELTLYLIQQNKKIISLESDLQSLKNR